MTASIAKGAGIDKFYQTLAKTNVQNAKGFSGRG
jgi:hypothetical protein